MGRSVTNHGRRVARVAGGVVLALAASLAAALFLLPLAVRGFVRTLDLTLNACVWLAAAFSSGADTRTILGQVVRVAGAVAVEPRTLTIVGGLVLVGAVALYGLQRLLGSEEELSK